MNKERIKLLKKIADFQQEAPILHKGTKGYGYTYTDLTTIFKAINPLLKKHNLGFTQGVTYLPEQDVNVITTEVFCTETGEGITSTMKLDESVTLKGMNKFQINGSAITYVKRYQISAMLGLITDKDIDAAGEQDMNKKIYITSDLKQQAITNLAKVEKLTPSQYDQWVKYLAKFTDDANKKEIVELLNTKK